MQQQAAALTPDQRIQVAEYLVRADRKDWKTPPAPVMCTGEAARFDLSRPPAPVGWGYDNKRFTRAAVAGLEAADVPRLKLKWAFAFPSALRARSQPVAAMGAVFVGSHDGSVYAFDLETGCVRWTSKVSAEVRTAVVVEPWAPGTKPARNPRLFFGDLLGRVYAMDALTGQVLWRARPDDHANATITGTPTPYGDTLYVPVSSLEVVSAIDEKYACCTFRGSILAYDAASGKRLWQTFTVGKPKVVRQLPSGHKLWGPSGVAIWNSPALDEKRGVLYFTTGDNYSPPTTGLSDAVIAMDLKTGRIKWSYQALAGDYWNTACQMTDRTNCPEGNGPDFDFGAAAILAKASDGREYVLAGQKSGWVYALDPKNGKLVWKTRVGRGGIMAGVYFGMAVKGDLLFVPISDPPDGETYDVPARPGIYALDIRTGEFVWKAPNDRSKCGSLGPACEPGIAAPATVIDDLVAAGSSDGWMRFYEAKTGRIVWEFNTVQDFVTVGGGTARGGSMGGSAGQLAWHGTLVVPSGYAFSGRMGGNVLLVFGVE